MHPNVKQSRINLPHETTISSFSKPPAHKSGLASYFFSNSKDTATKVVPDQDLIKSSKKQGTVRMTLRLQFLQNAPEFL